MILLWKVWATVNHVCHIVYPYKPIKNFICYCQGDFVWCVHISLCFYEVIETRVKVWENSKKLWKHSPAVCVCTAFLVLPNLHLCFYNSKGSQAGVVDIDHAFHLYYKCYMWIEFQSILTWLRGFSLGTPVSSLLKIDPQSIPSGCRRR